MLGYGSDTAPLSLTWARDHNDWRRLAQGRPDFLVERRDGRWTISDRHGTQPVGAGLALRGSLKCPNRGKTRGAGAQASWHKWYFANYLRAVQSPAFAIRGTKFANFVSTQRH
jgi:hypothetical protein